MSIQDEKAYQQTIDWFTKVVLGLNLCPFAHSPARAKTIRWVVITDASPSGVLEALSVEIDHLSATPEEVLATTVLIAPNGFEDFEDYLDMLAFLSDWLEEVGQSQDFQLASFHPRYQFDGLDRDDRANWTNRSPLPLFHIIREASITRVTDAGADIEAIVERNIDTVRGLNPTIMRELFPHYDLPE